MTTQIQRRRGTTAQHSTFTGAEAELTVDTTKDTVVVHDGSTVGGRPLLREDQSNLPTSAPTTGIYNASGSLAISTNGTGKLFINSSGVIEGYNTQSTGAGIVTGLRLNSARATGGDGTEITFNLDFPGYSALAGIAGVFAGGGNNGYLTFKTVNSGTYAERLRITSDGKVGVGTSSPDNKLSVGIASADEGVELKATYNGFRIARFGLVNPGVDNTPYIGSLLGSDFGFITNNTRRMTITADGKVGIGTTNLSTTFTAYGGNTGIELDTALGFSNRANTGTVRAYDRAGSAYRDLGITGANILFGISDTERARIDSSGRLLVGTSSAFSAGTDSQYGKFQMIGNTFSASGHGILAIGRGEAATSITSGEAIGFIPFTDNAGNTFADISCLADANAGSGDYPGRLVFSTTADGASSPTERMRLINSGFLKVSNDGSYQSTTSGNHEFTNTLDSDSLVVRSTNASYSGNGILALATRNTTNNSFYAFSYYNSGASAYRFRIADSGNATNTNNSYGAISDAKLKENIVDATSQWSDIKALQVRKYNFKKETGQQTHTQIGLIAQEVELVSPGLVSESPDRDAEGNDLGTVTKSVNYSVLYMKAVKALQEAMERIETLEAKVAALESA